MYVRFTLDFFPIAKWPKETTKKETMGLGSTKTHQERERKDHYLHGNPKVTSVTMAPLSTYCNLILQSIICLCEKPNFTKKIWFLIIIAFPMTKKNSKIMNDNICSNQTMPS